MKCHVRNEIVVPQAVQNEADRRALDKAMQMFYERSEMIIKRTVNLIFWAMGLERLSPRTGERVRRRLEDYVLPMWDLATQPDEDGKTDGDWMVANELDKLGWPHYELEEEM